jgi:hypothetical protein
MSPQLSIFILVIVFVVGWFAVGTQLNVRKGETVLKWLQDGLPLIGEKATLRWLGSSAVELKIEDARAPFRSAQVLVLLEPRDVPLIWWYFRLRGRRDLFIFRGELRSGPRRELEVLDVAAWSARRAYARVKADQWPAVNAPAPLSAFAAQASTDASAAIRAAALDGCPLARLSLRRSEPNLEIQWPLDELRKHSAREVVEAIQKAAQST